MATYTWDAIYDRLKVDQGGLPNKSTQDMLDTFWTLAGYPDGTLGADEKVAFYESQGAIGDSLGDLEYDYWYRIGPNILAAKGAVFAIDAAQSVANGQWALNRGSGGQVLRAKYGSVARAEIRNGVGLVNVGRVSGTSVVNCAATPYTAAMYSPNELEVVVRVSLDNWATYADTASMGIIGRNSSSAANNSFNVSLIQTTRLLFFGASDGTSYLTTSSTAAVPFADGQMVWLKVTWRKSDGRVQFWWAADQATEPSSWTQLGADRTLMAGVSMNTAGTDDLRFMGCPGASYYGNGVMARAILRTAIGGANALDVDFAAQPDLVSSFVASTGQTVTVTAANAVDTNDPLWLPWTGENYVYLPGLASNTVTTTHSADQNPVGNLNFSARLMMYDWTPSASSLIYHKFNGTSTGFYVQVLTDGRVLLVWGDGVGSVIWATDAAMPFTNGAWYWVNITLNLSTGVPTFRWAADSPVEPSSWSVAASSYSSGTAGATTIATNTSTGPQFGAANGEMALKRIIVRGGSTTNVDVDFTQNTNHSSFTCTTGQTVTINRATSGRKTAVVTRPIWLFGTDDYLEVADNDLLDFAANESYTLVVVARVFGTYTNKAYAAKKAANGVTAGYALHYESGGATLFHSPSDGTLYPFVGTARPASGALAAVVAVRDVSADQNIVYVNGATASVTDTTTATLANAQPFRVSGWGGGGGPLDMEVLAVGIFRRALSATEIAQIVTYYGAS